MHEKIGVSLFDSLKIIFESLSSRWSILIDTVIMKITTEFKFIKRKDI